MKFDKFMVVFWTIFTSINLWLGYIIGGARGVMSFITLTLAFVMFSAFEVFPAGWAKRSPWLAGAVISLGTASLFLAMACAGKMTVFLWIAGIALTIAIFCLIKHFCFVKHWCRSFGTWWRTIGWPETKMGFKAIWTWMHVLIRRTVMPMIVGVFKAMGPTVKKNFFLLLSFGFGCWSYNRYQESAGWGQSVWFWSTAVASFIFFLIWSPFTAKKLAKLTDWLVEVFLAGIKLVWTNFMDKASGKSKALVGGIAAAGAAISSSLIQEVYERNTGWLFHLLHINTWEFGRISWSGALMVSGGFLVGIIILMLILPFGEKSKKKDAAKTKEAEKSAKQQEADLIKLIRKHRGEEGVAAYKKDKKAGKKFSW